MKEIVIILCIAVVTLTDLVSSAARINNVIDNLQRNSSLDRFSGEECARECKSDEEPRICYFKFILEYYHAMGPACGKCDIGIEEDCFNWGCITADGVERGLMSINRQVPGPAIHVCKNDFVVFDVANHAHGTAASIHWHGFHQRDTPHMDGVPYITQCPIPYSTTFRYAFKATESGTQFYHSHSGHHKVNGQYGAFIVREPFEKDPLSGYYDHDLIEHSIIGADWMHILAEEMDPGTQMNNQMNPTSVLINGRGRYRSENAKRPTQTPFQVYRVNEGKSYRFRFINSASHVCPLQLQIEDHDMIIIASDSFPVMPQKANTLISTAGERYDFIVDANQNPQKTYFIRLRMIGSCTKSRIEQFAILSYADETINSKRLAFPARPTPSFDDPYPSGIYINHPNTTCGQSDDICVSDLNAIEINTPAGRNNLLYDEPDYQIVLPFQNYIIPNDVNFQKDRYYHFMTIGKNLNFIGAINNLSFSYPSYPPLTQPEQINDDNTLNADNDLLTFCDINRKPRRCDGLAQCPCTHRLKVQLNATVELIIVDEAHSISKINHPFHLHGFAFHVMDMGQHPDGIPLTAQMVERMLLTRTFDSTMGTAKLRSDASNRIPALKDTTSVPSRGFTRVRFRADNPGFWFMHCHFEWHMAIGMALVVQVGETNQMVTPPTDFPKCSNYIPNLY